MVGLKGIRIEKPEQIDQTLAEILNTDNPVLLDVLCDPNVPIIPPHLDKDMLGKFSKAMLKGDPELLSVLRQIIK